MAGRGATVELFAPTPPGTRLEVEPHRLFFDEITLETSYSASPLDTRPALELIRQDKVRASEMITHRFPLADATEAFRVAADRASGAVKVVVEVQ